MSKATAQSAEDPILQWVTFRLDNESYGINVMQVQEVLRYTEIAPVPGAPSYVLGIINLRGNVVTVIDTRQRFGLDPAPVSDNTRIVIIEADKQVVGILVDSVAEVVYLKQSEIETAPNVGNEESAKFIQGVCNKNGELLILVELDKMMTEGLAAGAQAEKVAGVVVVEHAQCLEDLLRVVPLARLVLVEAQRIELLQGVLAESAKHRQGAAVAQEGLQRLLLVGVGRGRLLVHGYL